MACTRTSGTPPDSPVRAPEHGAMVSRPRWPSTRTRWRSSTPPSARAPAEVERARRIVAAFEAAPGVGVTSLDGQMLDRPHLVLARRVLELAERAKFQDRDDDHEASNQR